MKICTICKLEKPFSDFSFRNLKKEKYQPHCKMCVAKRDKESYNTAARKISIRKAAKTATLKIRQFIIDFKKEKGCCRCGDKRYYVLDFHHTKDKEYEIGKAAARGISINTLLEEMNKCELVCSNCHREIHFLENKNIDVA